MLIMAGGEGYLFALAAMGTLHRKLIAPHKGAEKRWAIGYIKNIFHTLSLFLSGHLVPGINKQLEWELSLSGGIHQSLIIKKNALSENAEENP